MSLDLLGEARRRLDAGDPSSALRLAERALEAGRASGSPKALASAAHLVGECLYATGDVAGARRAVNEALAVTQKLGDPEALGADMNLWGILEITEGRRCRSDASGSSPSPTLSSTSSCPTSTTRPGRPSTMRTGR